MKELENGHLDFSEEAMRQAENEMMEDVWSMMRQAISKAMDENGVSAAELAKDIGTSAKWINDVLAGAEYDLPVKKMATLLHNLGYSVEVSVEAPKIDAQADVVKAETKNIAAQIADAFKATMDDKCVRCDATEGLKRSPSGMTLCPKCEAYERGFADAVVSAKRGDSDPYLNGYRHGMEFVRLSLRHVNGVTKWEPWG